jgi:hypothetical protein
MVVDENGCRRKQRTEMSAAFRRPSQKACNLWHEFITGTVMGPIMLVAIVAYHTPYLTSFKWHLVDKQGIFCSPVPVNM